MKGTLLVVIIIGIFSIWSCVDEVSKIEDLDRSTYEPEIAVPLGQGRFTFSELLGDDNEDTYLTVSEDNVLTFVYSGEVKSQGALEIFDDIQLLPFAAPDSLNLVPIELDNDISIRYGSLSGGLMNVLADNPYDEPITIELSLPEISRDGVPFRKLFGPYDPLEQDILISQPLAGLDIDLTSGEMRIGLVAIKESNGERDVLPDDSGGLLLQMTFSYVEGYWAREEISMGDDTIQIEVFETLRRGDMAFEEPVVTVTLDNSFGFPVKSDMRIFELHTLDEQVVDIESPFVDDGFYVNYPTQVGERANTVFEFDKDNSNLEDITSIKPLALYYDMDAIANPDQDTSIIGYMTDSSNIIVNVTMTLPLKGSAQNFEASDTIEFDFPETTSEALILDGELKMVFESTIPVDMDIQAYLLDDLDEIIDSLHGDELLSIKGSDDGGIEKTVQYLSFDNERYQNWEEGANILMVAKFSSVGYPEFVVVRPDQYLDLKLGLKAKLTNL